MTVWPSRCHPTTNDHGPEAEVDPSRGLRALSTFFLPYHHPTWNHRQRLTSVHICRIILDLDRKCLRRDEDKTKEGSLVLWRCLAGGWPSHPTDEESVHYLSTNLSMLNSG